MTRSPLIPSLRPLRRRLLAVRTLEAGLAGAVGGGELAAVVTVLRILVPQAMPAAAEHPFLPLVMIPFGFAVAALVRLISGVTYRDAALAADRAAGLRECLATALEVQERSPQGLLDETLTDEAVAAARSLDPRRLALAVTLARRSRILLVGAVVLVAACFIPSLGGPPLQPQAAGRAAEALERLAARPDVAPAVREKIVAAVESLRRPSAQQADANAATADVVREVARLEQARRDVARRLADVPTEAFQKMLSAARQGDTGGAAAAAEDLAGKLTSPPGAGGVPPADRERLAAGLTDAAATAKKDAPLGDLGAKLADAAESIRRGSPDVRPPLSALSAAMTAALSEKSSAGGVAAVVDAVGQARRTLGLPDATPAELVRPVTVAGGATPPEGKSPLTPGEQAGPTVTGAGALPAESIPANVRPEDREVVRRYFGG